MLRDLNWLLNTANFASHRSLDRLPHVADSTLNYGIPSFAGLTATSIDPYELQRMLHRAIRDFEPRINAGSLEVRVLAAGGDESSVNALIFEIAGEIWARPLPLELYLKTEVDLESGKVTMLNAG